MHADECSMDVCDRDPGKLCQPDTLEGSIDFDERHRVVDHVLNWRKIDYVCDTKQTVWDVDNGASQ